MDSLVKWDIWETSSYDKETCPSSTIFNVVSNSGRLCYYPSGSQTFQPGLPYENDLGPGLPEVVPSARYHLVVIVVPSARFQDGSS